MKKIILAIMFLVPLVTFAQEWEDEVYFDNEQGFVIKANDKFDQTVYMEVIDRGEDINKSNDMQFFRHPFSIMTVMNYDSYGKKIWRSIVFATSIDSDRYVIHSKELAEHINNSNGYSKITYVSKDTNEEITIVVPCKYY